MSVASFEGETKLVQFGTASIVKFSIIQPIALPDSLYGIMVTETVSPCVKSVSKSKLLLWFYGWFRYYQYLCYQKWSQNTLWHLLRNSMKLTYWHQRRYHHWQVLLSTSYSFTRPIKRFNSDSDYFSLYKIVSEIIRGV